MIVQNYQEAATWLSKGKRKWERPLYTRGLRLRRKPATNNSSLPDIEVYCRWTQQALVTYHGDGTTTIQSSLQRTSWGGTYNPLYSWSQRTVFTDFADLRDVYQRKRQIHVVFQDAAYKPGKLSKCRRCKGSGLVDGYCYQNWCYKGNTCTDPDIVIDGYPNNLHRHKCEHGQTSNHYTPKSDTCLYCNGSGQRIYGSGYVSMLWDGSPLRLQNGSLVNNKPSELEKAIAAYVPIS